MPVVLRASGDNFDIDAYIVACTLPVCAVKRRGEPVFPKSQPGGRTHLRSAVHVSVSDADFNDFSRQVAEATAFLRAEGEQLRRLIDWPGVDGGTLDFGIERRDVALQCDCFPAELVRLAGEFGLDLELSQYLTASEYDAIVNEP